MQDFHPCGTQKSLKNAARYPRCDHNSLCPMFWEIEPCWTLAHEWMFWIMPASSSVTVRVSTPGENCMAMGMCCSAVPFKTLSIYIDLAITLYVYIQFMDVVGFSYSFGIFWISPSISKHLQAKTDPGEQLQRAAAVFPIRTLGKAAAVSFLGSQIAFGVWVGHGGTWNLETPWSFMMAEGWWKIFVMDENTLR